MEGGDGDGDGRVRGWVGEVECERTVVGGWRVEVGA